jgi:hypothetical protein
VVVGLADEVTNVTGDAPVTVCKAQQAGNVNELNPWRKGNAKEPQGVLNVVETDHAEKSVAEQ